MTREMRQVLAELELLSHGKATAWNASGSGKAESREPAGESAPPHLEFRLRALRGEDVLEEAREVLRAWRVRQAPAEGDGSSEDDWILRDGEGYAVEQVARKFNVTPTRVRKLRMADNRDTEFGLPKEFARQVAATPERIRNLAAQGCTERQIAFQVGASKSTVRRALGRAA